MGKILGYARVSTSGQDISSQRRKLLDLGAVVVFADIASGSRLDGRNQIEAALALLEPGDEILSLHPDRVARDTADLLTVAKRVVEKGAVLRIHDPAIRFDGTDMMSEIMLTVLGMVGMMEKHFIKSRQARGIEAAKLRGVYRGRPASIDPALVKELHALGNGPTAIAKKMGIGRASVYRLLATT